MSLEGPKPTYVWDDANKSWRPAHVGEAGELVWNATTRCWQPGTVGGNWKWNASTRVWEPGPGGDYVYNRTTRVWDKNTDRGEGGSYFWDETTDSWIPAQSLYAQTLSVIGTGSVLYDPSDLTSLYQSRTGGSTGAVDAVVGIMLDKSQMGNRTAAAFLAAQSELVTNGGFDSDTAWTKGTGWTISGGQATGTALGLASRIYQSFATVSGAWYRVQYTVSGHSGTGFSLFTGTSDPPTTAGAFYSANGTYIELFQATGATTFVGVGSRGAGPTTLTIDNVSVRAIPGSHALAPSDAARPILRQSGSLYYLDTDGVDDWMQVLPTKNLGEQWWHVGGWQSDATGDAPFGVSNQERSALSASGAWNWYDTSSTTAQIAAATITAPHVLTVEQASISSLTGRINGATGSTINPYDGSTPTAGLSLFSRSNAAFAVGLDGRFYAGAWNAGALSSADRSVIERWVGSKSGVVI